MTEINFKDLPVPAYFTWEGTHYQKVARGKIRKFGDEQTKIIRANPIVTYWGQDINDFWKGVNNGN